MGCFYTGFSYKRRKNGVFKIGETSAKTPSSRFAQLRQSEGSWQGLNYLILSNETKPERLFIESYVRAKMSQIYTHFANDHFAYKIQGNKYKQAKEISELAIKFAIEACNQINIDFLIGTKTYKRG